MIADKDKDGRLNFEEFKVLQKRIYDEDKRRFGDYNMYSEDQLLKMWKFMCFLARSDVGPSRGTFKKRSTNMVQKIWFPLFMGRAAIKNPDSEDVENTWTPEMEREAHENFDQDMALMEALPKDVQEKMWADMMTFAGNYRPW